MLELCSIASGSSGNCIYVGTDNNHILVDAGISGKKIENGLNGLDLKTSEIKGVLVTHEHIDHIGGLGVISRRYGLPIYATQGTIKGILNSKSVGKIDESLFRVIKPNTDFEIGDIKIHALPISHDAAEPVAYRFSVEELQNLDALLLEANHDINMLQVGKYPYILKQRILGDKGHLSNERSGQLLGHLLHDKFGTVMLGHLSKDNNLEELAYETVRLEVTLGDHKYKADDFPIKIAKRDELSERICV